MPVKHDCNPVLNWIQRSTGLRELSASLVASHLMRTGYIAIFVQTAIMRTDQEKKETLFFIYKYDILEAKINI